MVKSSHIQKICPQCGTKFSRPPSLARIIYCSKACANLGQTGERKEIPCETCGNTFISKKDHGVWKKYCCQKCFRTAKHGVKEIKCQYCGSSFQGYFKSDQNRWRKYCKKECANKAMENKVSLTCSNCGQNFDRAKSKSKIGPSKMQFCSQGCKEEGLAGKNSSNYKGGRYINQEGSVMLYVSKGYWRAEHRLVVEKEIGRNLHYYSEPILHINGIKTDNNIDNLYVCESYSEMQHILRSYDVPYPVKSNIKGLKS